MQQYLDSEITISYNPTNQQFIEIEAWLFDENKKKKEGFYKNLNFVKSAFDSHQIAVITYKSMNIGFVTWFIYADKIATIEIAEIHPKYRKKGFGKKLITSLIDYFISKNVSVIKLQCAPAESEKVWKKLGFIEFPNNCLEWNSENKELYKIIVPHSLPTSTTSTNEYIELWDKEIYKSSNIISKWKWDFNFITNSNLLTLPIIHPCDQEWRIQWVKDKQIIQNDKVKYFNDQEIRLGDFLII